MKLVKFKRIVAFLLVMSFVLLMSASVVFAADPFSGAGAAQSNPFLSAILTILKSVKNWILAVGGAVTVVMCAVEGAGYQAATAGEREEKIRSIRSRIIWGAGLTFIIWFVAYVLTTFNSVNTGVSSFLIHHINKFMA